MKMISFELEEYWDYELLDENSPLLRGSAASCIDQKNSMLFVFGGITNKFTPTSELVVFDISTSKICKNILLPVTPRINHEMYFYDNKLYIVGGLSYTQFGSTKVFDEILIYDLENDEIEKIDAPNMKFRSSSVLSIEDKKIYYYGGLNCDPQLLNVFDVTTKICDTFILDENIVFKTGSTSICINTDKVLCFSGFTQNNYPICHSEYVLMDLKNMKFISKKCNEFVGRTFSKAVYIEKYKKVFFMLGTYNGMEVCRSIIYYDIEKDEFNDLYVQGLPFDLNESVVFYCSSKNRIFIYGGFSMNKIQPYKWSLDLNVLEKNPMYTEIFF